MDNRIMREKQKEFTTWFGSQIAAWERRREKLLADERPDESDFEKIKQILTSVYMTGWYIHEYLLIVLVFDYIFSMPSLNLKL